MFFIHEALIVVKIGYIYRLFDDDLTFKKKLRTFVLCYSRCQLLCNTKNGDMYCLLSLSLPFRGTYISALGRERERERGRERERESFQIGMYAF